MSYRPWLQRNFKKKKQKEALPYLMNRDKLSLNDLLKIQRSCWAYVHKKKRIDAENQKISLFNDRVKPQNEIEDHKIKDYETNYEEPALKAILQTAEKLEQFRVGLISGFLFDTIEYKEFFGNSKFRKTNESERLIAQHKLLIEKDIMIIARFTV